MVLAAPRVVDVDRHRRSKGRGSRRSVEFEEPAPNSVAAAVAAAEPPFVIMIIFVERVADAPYGAFFVASCAAVRAAAAAASDAA